MPEITHRKADETALPHKHESFQINFGMFFLAGLLGPTLRAEEGETVVVTFRNMATAPYSIHPHGVAYGKQSEGVCLLAQMNESVTAVETCRHYTL